MTDPFERIDRELNREIELLEEMLGAGEILISEYRARIRKLERDANYEIHEAEQEQCYGLWEDYHQW